MTKKIGHKLQALRKMRRMTQEELARRLNISRASVSNYEVGRRTPHLSELQRFAEFYGVDLSYFGVSGTDEIFEMLSRAKSVFSSEYITAEDKEKLYKEIMRLYLGVKS